jgi:hypothetical protein
MHPKIGVSKNESNPGVSRVAPNPFLAQDDGVLGIGGNEAPGEVLIDSGRPLRKRRLAFVENTFQLLPCLHDVSHVVVANPDPKTGFGAPGSAQHGLSEFLACSLIVSFLEEVRPFQQE